jgi:putative phage-type endonuclease
MSIINEFRNDIHNICHELFLLNIQFHLDEIAEHVVDVLKENNDYDSKNIYPEYIKQLIAELYPDKYGFNYNYFKENDFKNQVEYLLKLPQYAQRTEEWYKMKQNTIGASECSVVFGANPYDSMNSFILKKCGYGEINNKIGIHCQHGIKYEPIIQQLYCKRNNTTLYEFGSIRHSRINFISASPDGITPTGVMIEIKAPPKRIITGIPPIYYWYQMQQQLQVCSLRKVDFIECKIDEYDSYSNFIEDKGHEKGIIVEYMIDDKIDYIYPDKLLDENEIDDWILNIRDKIPTNGVFNRFIYWKLLIYSTTTIWRDDIWWCKNNYKYYEVWNRIEYYRKNGYEELIPKKRPRKQKNDEIIIDMVDNTD